MKQIKINNYTTEVQLIDYNQFWLKIKILVNNVEYSLFNQENFIVNGISPFLCISFDDGIYELSFDKRIDMEKIISIVIFANI